MQITWYDIVDKLGNALPAHGVSHAPERATQSLEAFDPAEASRLEQIRYFRNWLRERYAGHPTDRARQNLRKAGPYVEEALKTIEVNGEQVNPFSPFQPRYSAYKVITRGQTIFVLSLITLVIFSALRFGIGSLAVFIAGVSVYYLLSMILQLVLSAKTFTSPDDIHIDDEIVDALADADWPLYTILCPLYQEVESAAQLARALRELDYPEQRLQVLIMLEEDDEETRDALLAQQLPSFAELVILPPGKPRTKPRSCNYGFARATGDYVVIYDAEDIPDPRQLKKAVLAFALSAEDVACVQAKLNFYNTDQNALTRWFTVEYAAWYEMVMPGLQWANITIPLGGTSNHFNADMLRKLGAWDPFNVTEDCDLGIRLADYRMKTVMLDSVTYEEANSDLKNWLRQRSRWIKGFMVTYMVHMRNPVRFLRPKMWGTFFSLQWVVGGRTAVILLNPFLWAMILIYFLFRPIVGEVYDQLYPPVIFYIGLVTFVFGNLLYIYTHIVGAIRIQGLHLVRWVLLMPLYWMLASVAGYIALYQYIVKPHFWEKTRHGLHEGPADATDAQSEIAADAAGTAMTANTDAQTLPVQKLYDEVLAKKNVENLRPTGVNWQPQRLLGILPLPRDNWFKMAVITAGIAGLLAIVFYFVNGQLLLYSDAGDRLFTARRVIDSATPGLAQLGGYSLPLHHLALLPFVQNDFLFRTGLAGSIVGYLSYLAAASYLFLFIRRLTNNSAASYLGVLLFVLNPNILYLQATPLSEMFFFATLSATAYYFLLWAQEGDSHALIPAGLAALTMTLTRYEGWIIFAVMALAIVIINVLRKRSYRQIEGDSLTFNLLGGLGIMLWLAWGLLIFGDAFYFMGGAYASDAQQGVLSALGLFPDQNSVGSAAQFYFSAAVDAVGAVLLGIGVLGYLIFLQRKQTAAQVLVTSLWWIPSIFYIYLVYSGQVMLFVPELMDDPEARLFNVRYAVAILLPVSIFGGVFIHEVNDALRKLSQQMPRIPALRHYRRLAYISITLMFALIAGQKAVLASEHIVVLDEGLSGYSCHAQHDAVNYLAQHYDGGTVLLNAYTTPVFALGTTAGIDYSNVIYEGSGALWDEALAAPQEHADWILTNPLNTYDLLQAAINFESEAFLAAYEPVVQQLDNGLTLYRHRDLAPLTTHDAPPAYFVSGSPGCVGLR